MMSNIDKLINTSKTNLLYFFAFMVLLVGIAIVYKYFSDRKPHNN